MNDFMTAPHPIRRVLIANRGEIACRIIATCKRLGLISIAVYSDADAEARHVRLADEAVRLGPASVTESYLSIDALIAAARASAADVIHPGYGFLSENSRFVRAITDAGLIFAGPSAEAVETMGSKITARKVAEAAGVQVVPGFDAADASDTELAEAAERIGYPVLVKASAGGGGRGMRKVMTADDLAGAVQSARSEAASAFGDATVFLEKLILNPRHLEVQVFGDGQGGAVHFHERDCSVQRNHQKIIEEAPAPNLPEDVRQSLFDSAIKLTSAISYAGAGTIEFVMAADNTQPYFLEMNTRLQVEHPVTEAICGVDLVEWQLRQAAGLPLLLTQKQIRPRGHAIEVRLNAERPENGFLPDAGQIETISTDPSLRFETGVESGDTVSSHYDSMIAKLIAYGADRDAALDRLIVGVDRTTVTGIGTNLGLLRDCLTAKAFTKGLITTSFLEETFPNGWQPDPVRLLRLRGEAALAAISRHTNPLTRADGFRVGGASAPGQSSLHIEDDYGATEITVIFGPEPMAIDGEHRVALGSSSTVSLQGGKTVASAEGLTISARIRPLTEARMSTQSNARTDRIIAAPLAGLVAAIHVAQGDQVTQGQTLAVMEAMKLVLNLPAPMTGTVHRVAVQAGDTVAQNTILIELEEESS